MEKLKPYRGSLSAGVIGVILAMITKHGFKKETLPAGSFGKYALTFALVGGSAFLGEEAVNQAKSNEVIN